MSEEIILNFIELLKKHKVEIPIIQRDYVQGRAEYEKIRKEFLNFLAEVVKGQEKIKLDFIYGNVIKDQNCPNKTIFQPIDGQQRLTTLFLLHWYAAIKDKDETHTKLLLKFTYKTRKSSQEFCKKLVSEKIDVSNRTETISEIIADSPWFFNSWKKDPTIKAMLQTIDDINLDDDFKKIENLSEKLNLISFYYLELKDLGLTDDLYIKLNARGRLLTNFEKFKALFDEYINSKCWDEGFEEKQKFSFKIDNDWTNLFWNYRNDKNKIDNLLINFISTTALSQTENIKTIQELNENPSSVNKENFDQKSYNYLRECFDIYTKLNKSNEKNINFKDSFYFFTISKLNSKGINSIFQEVIKEDAGYIEKILFFAMTEYLRKMNYLADENKFCEESFFNWMRVIRNIVTRGDAKKSGDRTSIISSPESFKSMVSLIQELSEGFNNIYQFLLESKIKSGFAKEQITEEIVKAKLILASEKNKEIIFKLEDTKFCLGKIDFILDCIDYDKENIASFNLELAQKIYDVIIKYLNEDTSVNENFRRSLLTIADYKYYEYWGSSWFQDTSTIKRCLIANYVELEFALKKSQFKNILKKLIIKLIDKDLKKIISEFDPPDSIPNWKKMLIKETSLLKNYSYIAIEKNREKYCYLLPTPRAKINRSCKIY